MTFLSFLSSMLAETKFCLIWIQYPVKTCKNISLKQAFALMICEAGLRFASLHCVQFMFCWHHFVTFLSSIVVVCGWSIPCICYPSSPVCLFLHLFLLFFPNVFHCLLLILSGWGNTVHKPVGGAVCFWIRTVSGASAMSSYQSFLTLIRKCFFDN